MMFLVAKKKRREPLPNPSHSPTLGIPTSFNRAEKLTAIIPIKVQPSLKKALKQVTGNVSAFGRLAIIEKLERMTEEAS